MLVNSRARHLQKNHLWHRKSRYQMPTMLTRASSVEETTKRSFNFLK